MSQIVNESKVPGVPVFILGCLDDMITAHAQQVRAINLSYEIISQGLLRPNGRVAVVGAGIGGATAAVALANLAPGLASIDIYDAKDKVAYLQTNCTSRYLHPHIYDWPLNGSLREDALLPIMNWRANLAENVASSLNLEFEQVRRSSVLTFFKETIVNEIKISSGGGCQLIVDGPSSVSGLYDLVVLAIGFGYERGISELNHSYWAPSILGGPLRSRKPKKNIFVSGNGDGGLVDFSLAAYNGLDHRNLFYFITELPGVEDVGETLIAIDERAQANDVDIYQAYKEQISPRLPTGTLLSVQEQLRPDCDILFHTNKSAIFRPNTSILNRLTAFLAIEADRKFEKQRIRTSVDSKLMGNPEKDNKLVFSDGKVFSPDYRFLRVGPERDAIARPFSRYFSELRKHRKHKVQASGSHRSIDSNAGLALRPIPMLSSEFATELRRLPNTQTKVDSRVGSLPTSEDVIREFNSNVTICTKLFISQFASGDGFAGDLNFKKAGVWSSAGILWGLSFLGDQKQRSPQSLMSQRFYQSLKNTPPKDLMGFSGVLSNAGLAQSMLFILAFSDVLPPESMDYARGIYAHLTRCRLSSGAWAWRSDMETPSISATSYVLLAFHFFEESVLRHLELTRPSSLDDLRDIVQGSLRQDGLLPSAIGQSVGNIAASSVAAKCLSIQDPNSQLASDLAQHAAALSMRVELASEVDFERIETITIPHTSRANLAVALTGCSKHGRGCETLLVSIVEQFLPSFNGKFFDYFGNGQIWCMRDFFLLAGTIAEHSRFSTEI